jgi:hypothetical protein
MDQKILTQIFKIKTKMIQNIKKKNKSGTTRKKKD